MFVEPFLLSTNSHSRLHFLFLSLNFDYPQARELMLTVPDTDGQFPTRLSGKKTNKVIIYPESDHER